jgi:hypothetical protein
MELLSDLMIVGQIMAILVIVLWGGTLLHNWTDNVLNACNGAVIDLPLVIRRK